MRARPYTEAARERWDGFVRASKNGTFLFRRSYLEYHADRFPDASLLVEDDSGALCALLPATRQGSRLSSHAGLTYGGFVVGDTMTTPAMLAVTEATLSELSRMGVASLAYKTVPHIYHRLPAEEDRYALFRAGATLVRRDVLSVVDPRADRRVQERRRRAVKKAEKAGIEVRRTADLAAFWAVLEVNLAERHGAQPVHSRAEMELLGARFPEEIAVWGAYLGDELLAGVVVYDTGRVAHAQYIASGETGRALGALDLLFEQLIARHYAPKIWFDFGISNEDQGRTLNEGLIQHKEGFGARAIVHDFYELSL